MATQSIFTSGPFTPAPRNVATPIDFQNTVNEIVFRRQRLDSFESVIRPFVVAGAGVRMLDHIAKKRNKPGEPTEATIVWGQASNFSVLQDNLPTISSIDLGGDGTKKDPLGSVTIEFTEIGRVTETVRVSNPDDDSMYVDVKRIKSITFSAPDGIIRRFNLNS